MKIKINKRIIIILALNIFIFSCNEISSDTKKKQNTVSMTDSIDLYQTYPDIAEYLPNINIGASDKTTKMNFGTKQETFDSILRIRAVADTSLYNEMMACNARLIFNEQIDIARYEYLASSKNNNKIYWLEAYSPFDRYLTVEKCLSLFRSYPAKTRHSGIGLKVKARLEEYLFKKNIGKSLKGFMDLFYNNSELPKSEYYILIMGASWCRPCIENERALEYWYPKIDSSIVKFIGLSMDTNIQQWENFVRNEKVPWKTFVVPNSFENKIIKDLNVSRIPMNFLLDRDFNIIKQNVDIRKVLMGVEEIPWRRQ